MRNGSYQGRRNNNNNRSRNRNSSGSSRPHRNQVLDSNGPEGRVRGTAFQINEKYTGFAKDAFGRNDSILAENYHQHAEHYQRMINEFEEQNPTQKKPQHNHNNNSSNDDQDDDDDSNHDDNAQVESKKTPVKRVPRKTKEEASSDDNDDDLGLPTSIVAEPVKKPVRKTTRVPAKKVASAE